VLQTLWSRPSLAREVLQYLAINQATQDDAAQDAEPGKVLHESRSGEMAELGEIPFRRYYGSVDATLLFVMLAKAYWCRTGDMDFVRHLWPNIERALSWVDRYGDKDGDGFVEYSRHSADGLVNQGWKDSSDAVFHADGQPASAPIALCEVQAYTYAARLAGARMTEAFGESAYATELKHKANALRLRFAEAFWCDDLQTYALALDAEKQPCRVSTSNAGHALYTGIATAEHAQCIAKTLLEDDMFSGWGVRTVSKAAALYNPMSYHNGSIWPHYNALVAMGLARYGYSRAY
jgi:glycogen debranching enzyme